MWISRLAWGIETVRERPQSPPAVVAIEVKRAKRWNRTWEKPMGALAATAGVKVDRMMGVYCGERSDRFDDMQAWPVKDFVEGLFSGRVF